MGRVVSPAETHRQILREGARHGLRPVYKYGQCMVAQRELVIEHGSVVNVARERWDPFRSVDQDHPLSNIWRSRKQRHMHNLARLTMEADARRKAADDAAVEDRRAYRGKELLRAAKQVGFADFWSAIREVHRGRPNSG